MAVGPGGPQQAVNSASHAGCQGQYSGRCNSRRRADRARRVGTVISWVRMVAVLALAWKTEAKDPAARVRLNAMAASTNQAPFAAKAPEGKWANGPDRRSA